MNHSLFIQSIQYVRIQYVRFFILVVGFCWPAPGFSITTSRKSSWDAHTPLNALPQCVLYNQPLHPFWRLSYYIEIICLYIFPVGIYFSFMQELIIPPLPFLLSFLPGSFPFLLLFLPVLLFLLLFFFFCSMPGVLQGSWPPRSIKNSL